MNLLPFTQKCRSHGESASRSLISGSVSDHTDRKSPPLFQCPQVTRRLDPVGTGNGHSPPIWTRVF